jgi:cobalt-zinc-cadmium efflux system outer membrane protein
MRALSYSSWRLAVPLAMTAFILLPFAPPAFAEPGTVDSGVGEPRGELTLEAAISAALVSSPALAGSADAVQAQEARALQAGLWPNPQLQVELENVGGSGTRDGVEQSETTFRLAQLVELGGKRHQRRRIAELGREQTERRREGSQIAVVAEVRRRFIEALAAQERLHLALGTERAVAEGMIGVEKRTAAGTASLAERSSIRATHQLSRLATLRAERDLASAYLALAATWGSTEAAFSRLAGDLETLPRVAPLEVLIERLEDSPELKRLNAEVDGRAAAANLERARRIPDVVVAAGGRHFNDSDDLAAVFEVALPLPILDRRQGALMEAEHLVAKSMAERDAGRFELRAVLTQVYQRLHAELAMIDLLRDEALPRSRTAIEQATEGYKRGATHLDEVLDAQRMSKVIRDEYLDALVACHLAIIQIEQIAGTAVAGTAEMRGGE